MNIVSAERVKEYTELHPEVTIQDDLICVLVSKIFIKDNKRNVKL